MHIEGELIGYQRKLHKSREEIQADIFNPSGKGKN